MKSLLFAFFSISMLFMAAGSIADDNTQIFTVVKAQYGVGKTWVDVTDKVRGSIEGDSLKIKALPACLGCDDPAVEVLKQLKVVVTYNGKELTFSVQDGETLTVNKAALDASAEKAK